MITFKQFLQEFDRSDLQLQQQVADKKAADYERNQAGRDAHTQAKQRAQGGKVDIQTGDMVLANQVLFKIKDHKPVKQQDGSWKISVRNMKTGDDTWFDYNNFKSGKLVDTGKKHQDLYRILSWSK